LRKEERDREEGKIEKERGESRRKRGAAQQQQQQWQLTSGNGKWITDEEGRLH